MRRKRLRMFAIALIAISLATTLFAPRPSGVQASVAALFAPVSVPTRAIGRWIAKPLQSAPPLDPTSPDQPRDVEKVFAQNLILQGKVLSFQAEIEQLRSVLRDRASLGKSLLERSAPARVVGGEGDTLAVANSLGQKFETGMIALHYSESLVGIAGLIGATGPGAAQLRLLSDPAVRLNARIARFDQDGTLVILPTKPMLLEGAGNGKLRVALHPSEDLADAGVQPGDWVVFDATDVSLPSGLGNLRLGTVAGIAPVTEAAGFSTIAVDPPVNLLALDEVMVVLE